tara:strand:+ start:5927 stop:6268 length:342 start_codon:yes stop_codon:yes gene_type:complete
MAIERAALLQGLDEIQDKLDCLQRTHFGDKQAHFESYRDFVRDRLDNITCVVLSHMYMTEASCQSDVAEIKSDMCQVLQLGEEMKKNSNENFLDIILEIEDIVGKLCLTIVYV